MTDIVTEAGPEGQLDPNPGLVGAEDGAPASSSLAGLAEARDLYRTERDSAREELTAATARIEQLQRAEVERLASALSEPGDLFTLGGVTLADLLDADGNVDPEQVSTAVAGVLATRPGLRRMYATDPSQGRGGDVAVKRAPTFADLF